MYRTTIILIQTVALLGDMTIMRKLPKLRLLSFIFLSFLERFSAFTLLSPLPPASSSPFDLFSSKSRRVFDRSKLSAEQANGGGGGGTKEAPQYKKINGILRNVEQVGEGSFMLHLQVENDNDIKLDYKRVMSWPWKSKIQVVTRVK
jgi:hypothetical protein